jgi:hypothetical protein
MCSGQTRRRAHRASAAADATSASTMVVTVVTMAAAERSKGPSYQRGVSASPSARVVHTTVSAGAGVSMRFHHGSTHGVPVEGTPTWPLPSVSPTPATCIRTLFVPFQPNEIRDTKPRMPAHEFGTYRSPPGRVPPPRRTGVRSVACATSRTWSNQCC